MNEIINEINQLLNENDEQRKFIEINDGVDIIEIARQLNIELRIASDQSDANDNETTFEIIKNGE